MTTTTEHRYRMMRRADPYLPAKVALSLARSSSAAESAGIPPWADLLYEEEVTINGRDYLLTVEPEEEWLEPSDQGDCYGEIREPSPTELESNWYHPLPVEWPTVRDSGQVWAYYPGDTYEPSTPYHRGMARGVAREWERALLVREGWRYRRHQTGDSPMFRGAILRDVAEPSLSASLWCIDGLEDETYGRSYLWEVVQELAGEIEHQAQEADAAALLALGGGHLCHV